MTEEQIREFNPDGIILSGGPESTTEENSPRAPEYVFNAGVPVLGICYGMQNHGDATWRFNWRPLIIVNSATLLF